MATLVMTPLSQMSLLSSNGHGVNKDSTLEDMGVVGHGNGGPVDINGLQEEASDAASNQSTHGHAAHAAHARAVEDHPSNGLKSNTVFSSNGPNAAESQSGNYENPRAPARAHLPNGSNDGQHQGDQNEGPDSTLDTGPDEGDSQEKLDFLPVSEPQDPAGAFPPTFGQYSSAHTGDQDLSLSNTSVLPTSQHSTTTSAKSPSKPAASYVQGQDVHTNSVQMYNPQFRGVQGEGAVALSTNTFKSASFQSTKGECHQHQEHHTLLTSTSHPQSQFLLTISAPSPTPSSAPSLSGPHESSTETGLACLHQSSHVCEAPQHTMGSSGKEICQLPDCVMSRASAGMAAAGPAQLEHLLARVKHEKTVSRARAWEEGAKAKAHNRYTRDESKITSWENMMKAKAEARMRKAQENLDKLRAKHIEKMKNAVASAHCKAEEKRAAMEARRAEDIVKAEGIAASIRATGKMPRRCLCVPV